MLARPGAMHIQIAAGGVKFEIHSLERIFRIIGLGQGILGMKSGKHHFIQIMLNLHLLMMFALILYFLKPIIPVSQNPLFHYSIIPIVSEAN